MPDLFWSSFYLSVLLAVNGQVRSFSIALWSFVLLATCSFLLTHSTFLLLAAWSFLLSFLSLSYFSSFCFFFLDSGNSDRASLVSMSTSISLKGSRRLASCLHYHSLLTVKSFPNFPSTSSALMKLSKIYLKISFNFLYSSWTTGSNFWNITKKQVKITPRRAMKLRYAVIKSFRQAIIRL